MNYVGALIKRDQGLVFYNLHLARTMYVRYLMALRKICDMSVLGSCWGMSKWSRRSMEGW